MRAPTYLSVMLLAALSACSGSDKEPGTLDSGTDTPTSDTDTDTQTGDTGQSTVSEAVWLETFDYEWDLFNHRVSYLYVEAADPPRVAVVGGTSTTQQRTELDKSCDPDACKEFPARDDAIVTVGWGAAATTDAAFATASASAVVPTEGVTVTVTAPDPGASGEVSAVLAGFSLDTDYALTGGIACYQPGNGWHPRRLALALATPRREAGELVVDLTLHFVAGNTDDPDRVCVDEVNEQSQVPMTAEVLFVVGAAATEVPVEQAVSYPWNGDQFNPEEQPPPADLDHGLPEGLRGWSKLDWSFNDDKPGERGAYLRNLVARIEGDQANAYASNYSPITQLHDFSFAFSGTVVGVPMGGVTHASRDGVLPTGLDDEERPVIYTLDGQTPTE